MKPPGECRGLRRAMKGAVMGRVFGFMLAMFGVWLTAQSAGTVNGGFVVGAPLVLLGGFLMTKAKRNERSKEEI